MKDIGICDNTRSPWGTPEGTVNCVEVNFRCLTIWRRPDKNYWNQLRDNLNIILGKTGVKIDLQLYRKIEGIPSGPELEQSLRLEIKLRTSISVKEMEI